MAETTSFGKDAGKRTMIGTLRLGLVLGGLILTALPVRAQDAPPAPDRNPARSGVPVAETATSVPEVKPHLPGDRPTVGWSEAEVAAAKADCAKRLANIVLDYEPLPPLKDGWCGAPAPILISSIGGVAVQPPATMTCGLAVTLASWLEQRVQPAASAALGAKVVKIRNASSYICRNRYGGANTKISEHALANALDISAFELASGERVTVLESWPRLASSAPEARPAEDAPTASIVPVSTRRVVDEPEMAAKAEPTSNPFVAPTDAKTNPFVAPVSAPSAALPMPPPEAKPPAAPITPLTARQTAFVRQVHGEACKMFGTVLGPEANEAHKDHFHLDMKARRYVSICE